MGLLATTITEEFVIRERVWFCECLLHPWLFLFGSEPCHYHWLVWSCMDLHILGRASSVFELWFIFCLRGSIDEHINCVLASVVFIDSGLFPLSNVFPQSIMCLTFRIASRQYHTSCIGEAWSVVWHVVRTADIVAASIPTQGSFESISLTSNVRMMFPIV